MEAAALVAVILFFGFASFCSSAMNETLLIPPHPPLEKGGWGDLNWDCLLSNHLQKGLDPGFELTNRTCRIDIL